MAVLTTAEVATELGTDGRTLRRFLRSITPKENQPGKGSRWSIEKTAMRGLKKQFATWTAAQAEKAAEVATPADTHEVKEATGGVATS